MSIHALIVAAGKGTRFSDIHAKQYQKLGNKYVLQHSVACLNHHKIQDLTLVLADEDTLGGQLSFDFHGDIHQAVGGEERWQSVMSGVRSIRQRGVGDDAWILIHDAARPCLPNKDLQAILAMTDELYGSILATPVVDTLKFADTYVKHTVNRNQLWQALTPQMFRLKHLEEVLQRVCQEKWSITDETSAFEFCQLPIRIVPASRINMKLTYPEDLKILESIILHGLNE